MQGAGAWLGGPLSDVVTRTTPAVEVVVSAVVLVALVPLTWTHPQTVADSRLGATLWLCAGLLVPTGPSVLVQRPSRWSHPPKTSWPAVKAMQLSVHQQPTPEDVHAQFDKLLDQVTGPLPAVAGHLDDARADLLAFTTFPKEIWRKSWSNDPSARLNKGIRRRTDVVRSSSTRPALGP